MGIDKDSVKTGVVAEDGPREDSPLLPKPATPAKSKWAVSVVSRLLFTSFLVSLSFGVTQVP